MTLKRRSFKAIGSQILIRALSNLRSEKPESWGVTKQIQRSSSDTSSVGGLELKSSRLRRSLVTSIMKRRLTGQRRASQQTASSVQHINRTLDKQGSYTEFLRAKTSHASQEPQAQQLKMIDPPQVHISPDGPIGCGYSDWVLVSRYRAGCISRILDTPLRRRRRRRYAHSGDEVIPSITATIGYNGHRVATRETVENGAAEAAT